MRQKITAYVDNAITFLLLLIAGVTPLLFLNQTTEFFETPKLIFLIAGTVLLFGLWIFSWVLKNKVVITKTPLDFPLLALLVVIVVSTFFSATRNTAIYGNFPKLHGSAVSWITYILLYFVTVSHLKTLPRIKSLLYVLYASASLVGLISVLSFFGIFLPFDFARGVSFTTTGSTFSTIAFMLLLLPLPLLSIVSANKYLPTSVSVVLASFFSFLIVLTGTVPSFVALVIVYVLCYFVSKPTKLNSVTATALIPVAVIVLTLLVAYVPLPGLSQLHSLENNFPKEIQLPFGVSWKVSASAFRDAPFTGTGPSSYLSNFTSYRPVEYNNLQYWNFAFDTAYDEFLQVLGTLGVFGSAAFVLFCFIILNLSRKNLTTNNAEERRDAGHLLMQALAISGVVAIVLFAIHGTTLVSIVMTFFILAAFIASQKSIREHAMELSIGIKASASDKQFDLLPLLIFLVYLVGAVTVLFQTYTATLADYYHRAALTQVDKNGSLTYTYLQKAEALNPTVDLYRVDMAQTNFLLANSLVAQKGPTASNPNGTLTDQDRQTIQTLLSQAINEGRAAVILNPRSSRNWEVLASLYRNIAGVAPQALTFSMDAYGNAIQRDPYNPALRLNVGGVYYAIKNYDFAIRYFSDAVNLKPDYTNAYYNLAIALREKGDYTDAALVAQQILVITKNDPKNGDTKIAQDLLDDLKKKMAGNTSAATGQQAQAPAAETSSALGNTNVSNVNVNSLNNPPQVTPQPAVKQNPNANIPQVTTAPTKTP